MESYQTLPSAEAEAPDVKDDPTLSRVLISRVLIEEYEALKQPEYDAEKLQQLKTQPICTGDTVKDIYKFIKDAQHSHIAKRRAHYEAAYKDWIRDDQVRQHVVDEAVLADASGEMEGLRNDLQTEFAQKNIPAGEKRDALVESGIIEILKNRASGVDSIVVDRLAATTLRSALCLSGGGIRSATFNLGILQGLARHGLLDKFDYLSTVSGGGFIGGWLSAWKKRARLETVVEELRKTPDSPLVPDPKPVEHLRIYSNYLSPSPGLLSADSWTLIATVVRNILLNWFVFVPVLLAILLLPRMWASIVLNSGVSWAPWIGFIGALVGLSYIALNLPSSHDNSATKPEAVYKKKQGPFIFGSLIWFVISASALSVYLWKPPADIDLSSREMYTRFAIGVVAIAWMVFIVKVLAIAIKNKERPPLLPIFVATLVIFAVQFIIGYVARAVVMLVLPKFIGQPVLYSIFSTPLVLLVMTFEAVLLTGLTSRVSNDDDQEWWARAGAWILIVAVLWILVHSLVLYGPLLLLNLEETIKQLMSTGDLSQLEWADWGKLAGTIFGVLSGVITLFGGFSAKTPANSKEAQKAGTGGLLLAVLTQVLAPVFLAFVIILLSLGTNWFLISGPAKYFNQRLGYADLPDPSSNPALHYDASWHGALIQQTQFFLLLTLFGFLIAVAVVLGRFISTNLFSLQYLWRNRIIRAYLGASHAERRANPFTNFDRRDNLFMHDLWPQPDAKQDDLPPRERKLFHILNLALNLTGGEKLQWQDRKAESFTVSPLHAGSYWLGYRRSTHYGGTGGITLGASVAISGAFVSPNMGYMMNSAVVRFLMALFNVRFGWWLGNPGPPGDKTNIFERVANIPAKLFGLEVKRPFRLDSPRLSVLPFLSEAIGNIDKESSYVYLSDGGHFENLGLYEMVLRRCRFIVVCDATTDPDYSFESFAMSVRQIRVDLGVPIDMPDLSVGVPSQNLKNKYCAIGKIRYSCVDRRSDDTKTSDDDYDGILIFIKPSLIGEEPRDVINYWQGRSTFPQEVITDQWFSEAQFESYRALGSFIIDAVCEGSQNRISLANFAQKVRHHNLLNFRAFQEQISYLALTNEFKEAMVNGKFDSYRTKVRKFMESILQ
jgi:Patatin-like phospholipase